MNVHDPTCRRHDDRVEHVDTARDCDLNAGNVRRTGDDGDRDRPGLTDREPRRRGADAPRGARKCSGGEGEEEGKRREESEAEARQKQRPTPSQR
jgi:hypothetical protein